MDGVRRFCHGAGALFEKIPNFDEAQLPQEVCVTVSL